MATHNISWHEKHKNDPNIREARRQAVRRRQQKLKDDPVFLEKRRLAHAKWRSNNKQKLLQDRYNLYATHPEFALIDGARTRAKRHGIPFNLSVDCIRLLLVDRCPVLDIPLIRSVGEAPTDNSPTLDRIVPALGYVDGNVIIISKLANQIKSSATPEQILRVGEFYSLLFEQRKL